MGIQDYGRLNIQFLFNGKIICLKVTKFTTCDDVIHNALHKLGLPITKVRLYALFERTGSKERMLSGKTLVYKVWRSWGCEKQNFEFLIRSKDTKLVIRHQKSESYRKDACFNYVNGNVQDAKMTKREKSVISGKQIVLARYLYDLFSRSSNKMDRGRKRSNLGNNEDLKGEDRNTCSDKELNKPQREKCKCLLEKYYAAGSEIESDDSFSDISETNLDETDTMDTAFIKSSRDSDIDEGIDATRVTSADLDTAFLCDSETKCLLISSYLTNRQCKRIACYEENGNVKDNEFEMNISCDQVLKNLFGRNSKDTVFSEDDEMHSFMRSRLDSF